MVLTGTPSTTTRPAFRGDLATALANAMALTGATHAHDGTVDWTFALDDSLVQYLAKDETVTATYTISVKDDSGDSATDTSTQTVTVTITGTNDRPVITAGDVDGHVTEDVGAHTIDSGSTVYLTDSGAISFTDADTDDVSTATVALTGTLSTTGPAIPTALSNALATAMALTGATHAHAGEVDWTFAVDDSLVQYLAAGETVTATYTISVKDNSGDSATDTSTQTVTVTITGTNDTPVITAGDVDGHVTEDVGAHTIDSGSTVYLTDSGAISFTDVDTDDVSTATVALTGTLSTTGPAIPTALSNALATAMALTGATHAHAGTSTGPSRSTTAWCSTSPRTRPSRPPTRSRSRTIPATAQPTPRPRPSPSPSRAPTIPRLSSRGRRWPASPRMRRTPRHGTVYRNRPRPGCDPGVAGAERRRSDRRHCDAQCRLLVRARQSQHREEQHERIQR